VKLSLLNVFGRGRLIGDALRRYPGLFLIGIISITVVDLLDITLPLVLKGIIDAIEAKDLSLIQRCCLLYALIAIIQAIGRVFWRVGFFRLGTNAGRDIREQIHAHLLRLPIHHARKLRSGDVLTHAQSDMDAVRVLLEHGMITIFDAIIYLLGISLIMFFLAPKLAIVSLFLLPLIPYFVYRNEKKLKEGALAQQDSTSKLNRATYEGFAAIRVVKSFAKENDFIRRFTQRSERLRDASIVLSKREAFFSPQLEFIISASVTLFLYCGSEWVFNDKLSIGTFVAFQRYIQSLLWPTQAVGVWFSYLQRAVASSERIEKFLSTEEELTVKAVAFDFNHLESLTVSNLSYSYPKKQEATLKAISFSIKRGERVALIGPSSAGKSTLCNLILKVIESDNGVITLFGNDYRELSLEAVREKLASVEQRPFLFSDTIYNNIAPGLMAEDVAVFAKQAAFQDEIEKLPLSGATIIGERGVTLSGGQKQRAAIARSFARGARFLLWDNALSSVDLKTEAQIISALKLQPVEVSALLVTHRLSTTRLMDRILVLRNGVIEQDGTHDQLIANPNGWYFQFCKHQERLGKLESKIGGDNGI
jgi:ATP-binding cassette, subfamily B, multidrug efflux pump